MCSRPSAASASTASNDPALWSAFQLKVRSGQAYHELQERTHRHSHALACAYWLSLTIILLTIILVLAFTFFFSYACACVCLLAFTHALSAAASVQKRQRALTSLPFDGFYFAPPPYLFPVHDFSSFALDTTHIRLHVAISPALPPLLHCDSRLPAPWVRVRARVYSMSWPRACSGDIPCRRRPTKRWRRAWA